MPVQIWPRAFFKIRSLHCSLGLFPEDRVCRDGRRSVFALPQLSSVVLQVLEKKLPLYENFLTFSNEILSYIPLKAL